jgi:hypothetical protein
VAITSEEEKKNCCVDGPIIALLNIEYHCSFFNVSDVSEEHSASIFRIYAPECCKI